MRWRICGRCGCPGGCTSPSLFKATWWWHPQQDPVPPGCFQPTTTDANIMAGVLDLLCIFKTMFVLVSYCEFPVWKISTNIVILNITHLLSQFPRVRTPGILRVSQSFNQLGLRSFPTCRCLLAEFSSFQVQNQWKLVSSRLVNVQKGWASPWLILFPLCALLDLYLLFLSPGKLLSFLRPQGEESVTHLSCRTRDSRWRRPSLFLLFSYLQTSFYKVHFLRSGPPRIISLLINLKPTD